MYITTEIDKFCRVRPKPTQDGSSLSVISCCLLFFFFFFLLVLAIAIDISIFVPVSFLPPSVPNAFPLVSILSLLCLRVFSNIHRCGVSHSSEASVRRATNESHFIGKETEATSRMCLSLWEWTWGLVFSPSISCFSAWGGVSTIAIKSLTGRESASLISVSPPTLWLAWHTVIL